LSKEGVELFIVSVSPCFEVVLKSIDKRPHMLTDLRRTQEATRAITGSIIIGEVTSIPGTIRAKDIFISPTLRDLMLILPRVSHTFVPFHVVTIHFTVITLILLLFPIPVGL